ncbi:retrovirus-related pol polyprotein from transposon TNT 1-94 [Tanacetum coccineum]
MSNTNNNLQTQTSNALHNAIMEAGGEDRPLILAPVAKGSSETTTEWYMENYKNVSQDIQDQRNAKAEAVQIVLLGIDNYIYSTDDACPNACETWKAIKRLKHGESINVQDLKTNLYCEFRKFTSQDGESLKSYYSRFVTLVKQSQELKTVSYHKLYDILKQHQNEVNEIRAKKTSTGKAIVNSSTPTYDQEPAMVVDDDEMSKEKKIDKLMALISLSFKKIYKPTNNNLITSSNTNRAHQDTTLRINRGTGYNDHRVVNVAEARENVGTQIQEVTPDAVDNSRSIFDTEPLKKVQNNDDNYNVFANDREHLEQPESVKNTYLEEQGDTNITIDSLDMCTNGETVDQDDDNLARERDLLASLINKLKCEIDERKNCNKLLESSNKTLVDKLKGEIKDFKTKNKSLELSNNYFKEANNKLSKTNQLMFKDLKKFQAELERYHDVNYASKVEIDCAKAKGDLIFVKPEFFKNAQRANPRLYDIGCYNDNLALMLAPDSDKTIRLAQESQSKLRVIPTASVSRPQLKSNQLEDRVMPNNSQGKKQEVEDHRRNFKFSKNKTSVTACNDSLNAKTSNIVEIILFIVDSGCLKHMTGNLKLLIMEDLVQGNITIKRVYYVKRLNYTLFSVGQFFDADLKVAFRKSTCYIRDLKGNDLLTGSHGTDLYSITLQDTSTPNPICLMAKATSSQAWLWHLHLLHLNFNTINLLSKYDIVTGLPKLKFIKDHLCSCCELGKAKYETLEVLINFLRLVQRGLHAQVKIVRTDKGTEFLSKTLHAYFAQEGIEHQTSTARTLEQNDIVERRNRTLVEAARTMLSAAKVPLQEDVPQAAETVTMPNEMDLLFSLMFDELLNGTTLVVSKSSTVNVADAPDKLQQKNTTQSTTTIVATYIPPLNIHTTPKPTFQAPTQEPTVTATENVNHVETYKENAQVEEDEFINIFSTSVQEQGETSSCHVDSSNIHTFYQRHPSEHRWNKT